MSVFYNSAFYEVSKTLIFVPGMRFFYIKLGVFLRADTINYCYTVGRVSKIRNNVLVYHSQDSQSQDGLSQLQEEEKDDEFWEVNRDALKLFLEKTQNEAAKLYQVLFVSSPT